MQERLAIEQSAVAAGREWHSELSEAVRQLEALYEQRLEQQRAQLDAFQRERVGVLGYHLLKILQFKNFFKYNKWFLVTLDLLICRC